MGFFEDIAEALDNEGIESRFNDATLFVPIAPELEVQFVEIPAAINAANVFLARAEDIADDDLDPEFDAALVGVVFSVEAAVEEVSKHVTTDGVISILEALLDGSDDRLADLDFEQDEVDPLLVTAPLGEGSVLCVELVSDATEPTAVVQFVTLVDDNGEELLEEALELGAFTDVELLLNALEVAVEQAEHWESHLASFSLEEYEAETDD